jgi:small conductance mechanosensitive channel
MENTEAIVQLITQLVSTWGLRVVGAIAVLIIGRIAAGMMRGWTRRLLKKRNTDETLVPFFSNMVYYAVIVAVVIAVLGIFGIPTASFVAVLGAAGLAVGLALQGTLSSFAAGVMLLIFRPFKTSDLVEAGGTTGVVMEISLFTTELRTPDNVKKIVPNSEIYGATISNYTDVDKRRVDMVVGIGYDDDIGKAIEVITRVVKADSRVLADPEPQVAVCEMADSSVNLVVRPWCLPGDYWGVNFELTRRLKEELEANGCSIPFPQRDVHIHQADDTAA